MLLAVSSKYGRLHDRLYGRTLDIPRGIRIDRGYKQCAHKSQYEELRQRTGSSHGNMRYRSDSFQLPDCHCQTRRSKQVFRRIINRVT